MTRQGVLIADGNRRLADLMGQLLADEPGFHVVGIAHTAADALALAQQTAPDVVLASEQLGEVQGLELCASLRAKLPDATLLVWSHDVDHTPARPQVVDGVLDRGMTFRELLKAIGRVRRIRLEPRERLTELRL